MKITLAEKIFELFLQIGCFTSLGNVAKLKRILKIFSSSVGKSKKASIEIFSSSIEGGFNLSFLNKLKWKKLTLELEKDLNLFKTIKDLNSLILNYIRGA